MGPGLDVGVASPAFDELTPNKPKKERIKPK